MLFIIHVGSGYLVIGQRTMNRVGQPVKYKTWFPLRCTTLIPTDHSDITESRFFGYQTSSNL